MAENALYAQQDQLEEDLKNKYKQNWGTLMNFLGTHHSTNNYGQRG